MAAESAVLVTIATSLASGLLKEVSKKAVDAVSESSTVSGLRSAIFGGLEADLRRLEKEVCKLDAVLCSAQSMDPMTCDKNDLVLIWLKDVKDAAFYAGNLLDEIAYEKIKRKLENQTSRVAKLLNKHDTGFLFRKKIADKIRKFLSLTAEIQKEAKTTLNLASLAGKASATSYQTSSSSTTVLENLRTIREAPDTSLVLGRQADEELIVTKLRSPNNDQDLSVIGIVGRSGVGKTTLARMIYDSETVREHFGKRTWIFVSDHFSLERILDEMLQSVTGQGHNLSNKGAMEDKLQESLKGETKGYLLVLDDVWNTNEQVWNSVKSSLVRVTRSTRCSVLVTSQISDVATKMCSSPPHKLEDLTEADARKLFKRTAFANKTEEQISELEDVGEWILSKCKGLPLSIRTMGSLLATMNYRSQWESVERSEIWSISLARSNVMPWLLISFHHLPGVAIKQCFVHCSTIIGKGTHVSQLDLINSWMAQGFVQSTGQCSMEDVGQTYVETLVARCLLQVDHDLYFGHCRLWMHDLVHDLACDLQNACEVEHLQILGQDTLKSQYHLPKSKKLRKLCSLICSRASLSIDFAAQGRFLHDLRLINCGLKVIPSSIKGLKHLRYLSLRRNPLIYLSKSVGTLLNLQTIDVRECSKLHELPQEITMLAVNLRHILIDGVFKVKMPKGMGQLTCLRTLPPIELGEVDIRELGNLPFLSGRVVIRGLQRICHKEDVVEAGMKTKEGIKDLELDWRVGYLERKVDTIGHVEEIMDGLHPHSNLERLSVKVFGGKRISSWLPDMKSLKRVVLYCCWECEQLPTLGQLCFLQSVEIHGMEGVEVIGAEFYHTDDGREVVSAFNDMSRRRVLFPKLKHLLLEDMKKLREWVEPSVSTYDIFPCLERLEIKRCPILVSAPACFRSLALLEFNRDTIAESLMMILPNTSNLTSLVIWDVEKLESLSYLQHNCHLKKIHILSCKKLGELWPTPTPRWMGSLEELHIWRCNSLTSLPDIDGLPLLRCLSIRSCRNLRTLGGLERCMSIEDLDLLENKKLEVVPDLRNLSHLTSLSIVGFSRQMSVPGWLESQMSCLRELKIGSFSEEIDQLDGGLRHLPKCLKELTLYGLPNVNVADPPSEIGLLHQLETLGIQGYKGMERLPEWLGGLSFLRTLYILCCPKLKHLPTLDAMRHLTHLRTLLINGCPLLREGCREDGGEEWPKISHIADKII